jgi:hypothetical protein
LVIVKRLTENRAFEKIDSVAIGRGQVADLIQVCEQFSDPVTKDRKTRDIAGRGKTR